MTMTCASRDVAVSLLLCAASLHTKVEKLTIILYEFSAKEKPRLGAEHK